MGKKKGELADRHIKRIEFWTQLLEKSREKIRLFSNVSPGKENWIAAGAGKAGIGYHYQINMDSTYVYLYIDKGKEYGDINKKWFDYLNSNKDTIEDVYRADMEWISSPLRRSTLIRAKICDIGLKDNERWGEIQDYMVDAMIRFEKALKPHIAKLQ